MMGPSKFFFYHNAKAGGAFITSLLDELLPGRRSPLIENSLAEHRANKGEYASFKGYSVYAGHYGRDIFEAVNDGHVVITNFRHPIERIISLYRYFRYNVQLPRADLELESYKAVRLAKELCFEDFALSNDPMILMYLSNAHSRQLESTMFDLFEPNLDLAIEFVRNTSWFYVCEMPDLSLEWARLVLGWQGIAQRNVNGTITSVEKDISRESLDTRIVSRLCGINTVDLAIYDIALERLHASVS